MKPLFRILGRPGGVPVVIFGAVLLYGLAYRLRLLMRFGQDELTKELDPFLLLKYWIYELIFAGFLALLLWPLAVVARSRRVRGAYRVALLLVLQLFLGLAVLLYTTHYGLTFSVRSGLTWDMIVETFAAGAAFAMAGELTNVDRLHIGLLFVLFWSFYFLRTRLVLVRNTFLVTLSATLILFAVLLPAAGPKYTEDFRLNPILYTLRDMGRSYLAGGTPERGGPALGQMQSVALVSEDFVTGPPATVRRGRPGRKWNLVFVMLESTGGDYVFDTSYGNQVPMPFLKSLTKRSLWSRQHISTANTTPRGSFSVFSGLYPAPKLQMFVTRPDVRIPSLVQFLDGDYDSYLVYNGSLDWFFPHGFFRNSGVEMHGMDNIHRSDWKHGPTNGRNEEQMVEVFLNRLERAREPFVAVYHSYAAHWPYIDYGKRFDAFGGRKPKIHEWIYRYYNNLRLMDTQIERIYRQLEKQGRLDNTIIVVTGDHGQAFGKHAGNWIHSRASYMENYRVPLVMFRPGLLPARELKRPTQHVDILPTLLAAMGRPYNPALFQGESMLGKSRRKYDFLYGNERTLTSIDRSNKLKLQIALKTGTCWAFDLAKDPDERRRLSCDGYAHQKKVTLDYEKYQSQILDAYNKSAATGTAFHGQRHPFSLRARARVAGQ